YINNPGSSKPNVTTNKDFSSKPGEEIQFRPQKIKITLRPGVPVTFDMYYQPAKDFPLDMYFLMDNSYTMRDYAKELARQTLKVYETLKLLTNNVRLGIGSFVEKPALPYTDTRIRKTYAFKHHLSLTENSTLFKKVVNSYYKDVGSNYDSPESGLDALMQVMKCQEKIGWRNKSPTGEKLQSRRIIILATDATYHSAGDGKMVGAFKPNDMQCHLDANGKYDDKISRTLDYPSVSQINHVAKENNYIIVFAVLKIVTNVYEALAKEIVGAKCVELKGDKIVQIIKDHMDPSIHIPKPCENNKCESTQANPEVKISATITATDCKKVTSFTINPVGIVDKLSIELEIDCECQCEKNNTAIRNKDCNSGGFKQCGVCKCDSNRSGDTCETNCSDKEALNMEKCKHKTDAVYCSDHGTCVCGKCQCYTEAHVSYFGDFCQFDDLKCRKNCRNDRGVCKQGKCICKDPSKWTVDKNGEQWCDCPVSNEKCIGPFSKEPCSGRGNCACGSCTCNSIDGKDYYGKFCESCKDCAKQLCEQLADYAYCNFEKNTKTDCDTRFSQTPVNTVNIMNRTEIEKLDSVTGCKKILADENILVYKFKIDDKTGTLILSIQDELESPPIADIWSKYL
ncbi:Integrin beta, partial [Operophtera brumata]